MKKYYPLVATLFWLAAAPGAASAGKVEDSAPNPGQGRKVYDSCLACHSASPSGPLGPDLRGVMGRKAGELPGFRYSRALKNSRIVWNEATLETFLADPQSAVPGNLMPFPGLPDEAARRDLVAFLKTLR